MSDSGDDVCRVCRSPGDAEAPLYHPCKCAGSIRYVHELCLQEWLAHSKKEKCELCGHKFAFVKVLDPRASNGLPKTTLLKHLTFSIVRSIIWPIRLVLVALLWLALLPYLALSISRLYFWLGYEMGNSLRSYRYGKQIANAALSCPNTLAIFPNSTLVTAANLLQAYSPANHTVTLMSYSPQNVWTQHRPLINKMSNEVFIGQIYTACVIMTCLFVFLLREWITHVVEEQLAGGAPEPRRRAPEVRNREALAIVDIKKFYTTEDEGQSLSKPLRSICYYRLLGLQNRGYKRPIDGYQVKEFAQFVQENRFQDFLEAYTTLIDLGTSVTTLADDVDVMLPPIVQPEFQNLADKFHRAATRAASIEALAFYEHHADKLYVTVCRIWKAHSGTGLGYRRLARLLSTLPLVENVVFEMMDIFNERFLETRMENYQEDTKKASQYLGMRTNYRRWWFSETHLPPARPSTDGIDLQRMRNDRRSRANSKDEGIPLSPMQLTPPTTLENQNADSIDQLLAENSATLQLPLDDVVSAMLAARESHLISLQQSAAPPKKIQEPSPDNSISSEETFPLSSEEELRDAMSVKSKGADEDDNDYVTTDDENFNAEALLSAKKSSRNRPKPKNRKFTKKRVKAEAIDRTSQSSTPEISLSHPLDKDFDGDNLGNSSVISETSIQKASTTPPLANVVNDAPPLANAVDDAPPLANAIDDAQVAVFHDQPIMDLARLLRNHAPGLGPENHDETFWGMDGALSDVSSDVDTPTADAEEAGAPINEGVPPLARAGLRQLNPAPAAPPLPPLQPHVLPAIPAQAAPAQLNAALNAEGGDEAFFAEGDLEGILEAIGIVGPLLGLVQAFAMILLLITLATAAAILIPALVGEFVIGANIFKVYLQIINLVRIFTDPIVNLLLLLMPKSKVALSGSATRTSWLSLSALSPAQLKILSIRISNSLPPPFQGFKAWSTQASASARATILSLLVDTYFRLCKHAVENTTWHRVLVISCGLFSIISTAVLYIVLTPKAQPNSFRSMVEKVYRQSSAVMKAVTFFSIELLLFPSICGVFLDIATIPMFEGATFASRVAYHRQNPVSSGFLNWFTGTNYMFFFANFIGLVRTLVRPGVLWFIRDPTQENSAMKEILEVPAPYQMRKIARSLCLYGVIILTTFGAAAWSLKMADVPFFPYRLQPTQPYLAVPIDLMILLMIIPNALAIIRPRRMFKRLLLEWAKYTAHQLRLTSFIFGRRDPEEEGRYIYKTWRARLFRSRANSTQITWEADGGFCKVIGDDRVKHTPPMLAIPVTLDGTPTTPSGRIALQTRHVKHWTIIYTPPHLKARAMLFLYILWFQAILSITAVLVVPVAVGRVMVHLAGFGPIHDTYTFSISCFGTVILYHGYRALVRFQFQRPLDAPLHRRLQIYWTTVLQVLYYAVLLLVLVPLYTSAYVNLCGLYTLRTIGGAFTNKISIWIPLEWATGLLINYLLVLLVFRKWLKGHQVPLFVIMSYAWTRQLSFMDNVRRTNKRATLAMLRSARSFVVKFALWCLLSQTAKYIFKMPVGHVTNELSSFPIVHIYWVGLMKHDKLNSWRKAWLARIIEKEFLIALRLQNNPGDNKDELQQDQTVIASEPVQQIENVA